MTKSKNIGSNFQFLFKTDESENEKNKLSIDEINELSIEDKAFYYSETRINFPFKIISQSVNFYCDLLEPLFDELNEIDFLSTLFKSIDFDILEELEIMDDLEKSLSIFNKVNYFLEYQFKSKIDKHLKKFQNGILDCSNESINEKKKFLISIISKLKLELKNEKTEFNFNQTFNLLNNRIKKAEKKIISIDYYYQLTGAFNTSYSFELLNSFEIILESLKEYDLIQPFNNNINNDIKHPFKSDDIYYVFQYLDKYFKSNSKAKYTYIFDFIKDNLENTLNETLYFDFIISTKQIDMVNRAQATAINQKKKDLVRNLYLDYSNNTKK